MSQKIVLLSLIVAAMSLSACGRSKPASSIVAGTPAAQNAPAQAPLPPDQPPPKPPASAVATTPAPAQAPAVPDATQFRIVPPPPLSGAELQKLQEANAQREELYRRVRERMQQNQAATNAQQQ